MTRFALTLVISAAALACGTGAADRSYTGGAATGTPVGPSVPSQCVALLQQYEAAMQGAVQCTTAAVDGCAGREPVISYLQDSGQVFLTGLCNCQAAVNPASTTEMDRVVAALGEQGCGVGACPCPPNGPAGTCQATSATTGVCR